MALALLRALLLGASGLVSAAEFKIGFGSCSKPELPQPLWDDINAWSPDAWIWTGDIVYADTRPRRGEPNRTWLWQGEAASRDLYERQRGNPG